MRRLWPWLAVRISRGLRLHCTHSSSRRTKSLLKAIRPARSPNGASGCAGRTLPLSCAVRGRRPLMRKRFRKERTQFGEIVIRSAEKCAPAQQTFQVQVSVVLPRIADAAEYLDRGIAHGGQPSGEGLCPKSRQVSLAGIGVVGGPQRMDDPAASQFDGLVHVNAEMLDSLERTDDLIELLSYLCVFDGHVHDSLGGSQRVGGGGDKHVVDHCRNSVW